MKNLFIVIGLSTFALSACGQKTNQTVDRGIDTKHLSTLTRTPGIWVDGDGCEHWAIDDGIEGYQDNRLDRDGKPICGLLPPFTLHGPDRASSAIPDPI